MRNFLSTVFRQPALDLMTAEPEINGSGMLEIDEDQSVFRGVMYKVIALAMGIATLTVTLNATSINTAFDVYLQSGIFQDDGVGENIIVSTVSGLMAKFMETLLPIMSYLTIFLTLITLVGTIMYLTRQDYFDSVYLAKQMHRQQKANARKGGEVGLGGLKNSIMGALGMGGGGENAVAQFGFLKVYVMPDFKAMAFREATEEPMTIKDFLAANLGKHVLIFGFCMAVSDRTMLDLYASTGKVGVYFLKMAANHDWVNTVDSLMTAGTDHKPKWDTSNGNTIGKNKTKTFDAIYKQLKSHMNTASKRSTEFKTDVGIKLENIIDGDKFKTIPFDRKTFTVSAAYVDGVNTTEGSSLTRIFIPMTDLGFADDLEGRIVVYINAPEGGYNDKYNVPKTTDPQAWSPFKEGDKTIEFDLAYANGILHPVDGTDLRGCTIRSVGAVSVTSSKGTTILKPDQYKVIGHGETSLMQGGNLPQLEEGCKSAIRIDLSSIKLEKDERITGIRVTNIAWESWTRLSNGQGSKHNVMTGSHNAAYKVDSNMNSETYQNNYESQGTQTNP